MPERIPTIAITTNNSINVNDLLFIKIIIPKNKNQHNSWFIFFDNFLQGNYFDISKVYSK
jgi:hypothetical protein